MTGRHIAQVLLIGMASFTRVNADELDRRVLVIIVNRSPIKGDGKEFRVTVNAEERPVGGEPTSVELLSRQGLRITELKEERSQQPNSVVTHVYSVTLPDKDLNLAELEANVFSLSKSGEKKVVEHASYVLDLSFSSSKAKLVWSLPDDQILTSGEPRRVFFTIKTPTGPTFIPTATVQVELTSEACADFQSIPADSRKKAKPFAAIDSVNINAEEPQSGDFFIRPKTWSSTPCNVLIRPKVVPNYPLEPIVRTVQVKPNIFPALMMAILGAFANYFLGGLVRALALIRIRSKNVFRRICMGPKGSEVISMFLKGVLAFAAAILIQSKNVFGIEIQRDSLIGFLSLGFMFGFWPVDRLWRLFEVEQGPKDNTTSVPSAPVVRS